MTATSAFRTSELAPALTGQRVECDTRLAGRLSWYRDAPRGVPRNPTPLVLIHSVNAAPSAYEVKPLYDHYRRDRPVYALELPGFGFSARSDRHYTPRLMTDAIHELVEQIHHDLPLPVDAIALSLSAEFLARAAEESPRSFRSLALISPTGFEHPSLHEEAPGTTLGHPWLRSAATKLGVRKWLFRRLTSPRMIERFLRRSWGHGEFDTGLFEYDRHTASVPGAEYAPVDFLAGFLFSADSGSVYRQVETPVWVIHGNRGDFAHYPGLRQMNDRRNWTLEVMDTGALPHFERRSEFVRRYDAWSLSLADVLYANRQSQPNSRPAASPSPVAIA